MKTRVPEGLMRELQDAASCITNVPELRAYVEHFPSPLAGQIIAEALDFLAEPKVLNGKRDGRKIFLHVSLGYGPRLTGKESLLRPRNTENEKYPGRDILIAVSLYAEKEWPKKHELTYSQKIQHRKFYGVENPNELVYVFVNMLFKELRKQL